MTWQYLSKGRRPKDSRRLVVEKEGYGPNWYKQRWACFTRDSFTCQKCGHVGHQRANGSWDVSCHHIIKIKNFVVDGKLDWEKANSLDNLVTLCEVNGCHKNADNHSNHGRWVRM